MATTRTQRPSRSKAAVAARAAAAQAAEEDFNQDREPLTVVAVTGDELVTTNVPAVEVEAVEVVEVEEEHVLTDEECAALNGEEYVPAAEEVVEEVAVKAAPEVCPTCHQVVRTQRVKAKVCTKCGATGVQIIKGLCPKDYRAARRIEGTPVATGEHAPKLTENDVVLMRELRADGVTLAKLAKQFGVSSPYVSTVCTGKAWKHVAFPVTDEEVAEVVEAEVAVA